MKILWKVLVGIFALIGVVYMGLVLSLKLGFIGEVSCQSYPVIELASPNQGYLAEQLQEKCTSDNILKSVVWIENQETGVKWTVFSARAGIKDQSSGAIIASSIELQWLDVDTLQIGYPSNVEVETSLIGYKQGGVSVKGKKNGI